MSRAILILGTALLFFPITPICSAQGKLDKARNQIEREKSDDENDHDTDDHDDNHCCCDEGDSGFFLAFLFTGSPNKNGDRNCHYLFPDHPYPNGMPGYLRRDPSCSTHLVDLDADGMSLLPWSVRVRIENGNDFSGLNRLNGGVFLDTSFRLGFSTYWNYFHEQLRHSRSDEFVLGTANFYYRLLQSEYLTLRAGGGLLFFIDDYFHDVGGQIHLGLDVFPVRPIILSGELDWGGIGRAEYVHARISAGVIWRSVEIYAGYDARCFDSVLLDGPFVGMRLWF